MGTFKDPFEMYAWAMYGKALDEYVTYMDIHLPSGIYEYLNKAEQLEAEKGDVDFMNEYLSSKGLPADVQYPKEVQQALEKFDLGVMPFHSMTNNPRSWSPKSLAHLIDDTINTLTRMREKLKDGG